MRDLTALVDTRDCASPGCPNEADGPDGRCRLCRTIPSRRHGLTPDTRPGALAHLMNDDDQEVPTPVPEPACKVDGCANPDAGRKGSWVGLCVEHIGVEGRRRQELARQRGRGPHANGKPKPARTPTKPAEQAQTPSEEREAPPGTLTELAQEADQALDELIAAKVRHFAAVDRLRHALDQHTA